MRMPYQAALSPRAALHAGAGARWWRAAAGKWQVWLRASAGAVRSGAGKWQVWLHASAGALKYCESFVYIVAPVLLR